MKIYKNTVKLSVYFPYKYIVDNGKPIYLCPNKKKRKLVALEALLPVFLEYRDATE
jgi:hypothetical protein